MSVLLVCIGALLIVTSAILIYRMLTASVGEKEIEEVQEAEKGFKKQ